MIDRHNEMPMMPRGGSSTQGKQFCSPRNLKQAHLWGEKNSSAATNIKPTMENRPCRKFQITLRSLVELMTNRYTEWDGAEQTNNRWSSKYTFIHQLRVVSRVLYSKQVERACVLDSHVVVWAERVYWRRVCECLRRCVTLKTSIHPRISEEGEGQTQLSEIIWNESDSKSVKAVYVSRLKLVRRRPTHSPVIQWNGSMFLRRRSTTLITDRSSKTRRDEPSCPRAERSRWLAETFLRATDCKHQDSVLNVRRLVYAKKTLSIHSH